MKKIIKCLKLSILLMAFVQTGCKKDSPAPTNTNLFTETVTNIKLSEPVLLSFVNTNSNNVFWQITPKANAHITQAGNYATCSFDSAGTYTCVATANNKTVTYIVQVVATKYVENVIGFQVKANKQIDVLEKEIVIYTVYNAINNSLTSATNVTSNLFGLTFNSNIANIAYTKSIYAISEFTDGTNKQTRCVWLKDSSLNSTLATVPFMLGDKLNIKPTVQHNTNGTINVTFTTSTIYNYQCSSDVILNAAEASDFSLHFGGVVMAKNNCSVIAPPSCSNTFNNIVAGTYPLNIAFGNTTYSGSFVVDLAGKVTITWTHFNAININPLQSI
jgi:hypothetical protein